MMQSRGMRLAIAIWLILIVAVSVRVAVSKATSQTVVPIYRAAGERWTAGQSLYAPAPPHDTFRYPPGFAALFAVFAKIPETLSAVSWRLIGVSIFLWGLWRFANDVKRESFPILAVLSLPLVLGSFNNGQINVAIIGLILLGVADAAAARWNRSAIWLALAAGMKIYPIATGLLLILLYPRSLSWRLAIAVAAAFAMPFALHDPHYVWQQHLELVEWMQKDDRLHTYAAERVPRDWTVLTRAWLNYVPSHTVVRVVSAVSAVAMAGLVLFSRYRHGVLTTLPMIVVLSGIWMTLFGPATESVTYCLVAPGAAWLVMTQPRWLQTIAIAGYGLLVSPVIRDIFPQSWQYSVYGPHAAGTVCLLITAVIKIFTKDDPLGGNDVVPATSLIS